MLCVSSSMETIGLVTEEAADLPQEIIQEHQIVIVPVKLDWPEIKDLPGENTFQKMREAEKRGIKSFGKTSQPSPKDFLNAFQQQLERFNNILCITVTSKLSGTHNSAIQAKKFLSSEQQKKVFIIDSLNASAGESLFVLRAIDLIRKGKEIEEIVKELEELVPQVHLFFMFEDSKWLEASGRISSLVAALIKRMAKAEIRPLLALKKGVLVPSSIKFGAKDIPTVLFKHFKREVKKLGKEEKKIRVVITHGDDLKGAQRLKEMMEKEFKNTKVFFINIIDNILASLVGPNGLVCAWCEEKES